MPRLTKNQTALSDAALRNATVYAKFKGDGSPKTTRPLQEMGMGSQGVMPDAAFYSGSLFITLPDGVRDRFYRFTRSRAGQARSPVYYFVLAAGLKKDYRPGLFRGDAGKSGSGPAKSRDQQRKKDRKRKQGGRAARPNGRALSIRAAQRLTYNQTVYHRTKTQDGGKQPLRVRVSGAVKLWKTRPDDFRVPIKFGMYESHEIVPSNLHEWTLTEWTLKKPKKAKAGGRAPGSIFKIGEWVQYGSSIGRIVSYGRYDYTSGTHTAKIQLPFSSRLQNASEKSLTRARKPIGGLDTPGGPYRDAARYVAEYNLPALSAARTYPPSNPTVFYLSRYKILLGSELRSQMGDAGIPSNTRFDINDAAWYGTVNVPSGAVSYFVGPVGGGYNSPTAVRNAMKRWKAAKFPKAGGAAKRAKTRGARAVATNRWGLELHKGRLVKARKARGGYTAPMVYIGLAKADDFSRAYGRQAVLVSKSAYDAGANTLAKAQKLANHSTYGVDDLTAA